MLACPQDATPQQTKGDGRPESRKVQGYLKAWRVWRKAAAAQEKAHDEIRLRTQKLTGGQRAQAERLLKAAGFLS